MQGLELSEKFYREFGEKAIAENFPEYKDRIAAGLAGEGSECMGFDDDFSRDHDFDAGFCLWVTEEDYEKIGFRLERVYSKLPKEFMGVKRGVLSPVGGNRKGVSAIESFYTKFLGAPNAPDSTERWLFTPPAMLAQACNGKVFSDPLGEFSKVRNQLLNGYPQDVRKKKLAAHLTFMAQSGQYNYVRLVRRGETGAAQLAVFEFVRHALSAVYLINNAYEPFYKWVYKGLRKLPVLSDLETALAGLTELGNSEKEARGKIEIIEGVSAKIAEELRIQQLSDATCNDLEKHAYSITDKIADGKLRNMHVMDGI